MKFAPKTVMLPVLLGSNATSRTVAHRLYKKYSMISYIFDTSRSADTLFSVYMRFHKIKPTCFCDFLIMELIDFSTKMNDYTLVLIPCTKEYEELVSENAASLEQSFIISDVNFEIET